MSDGARQLDMEARVQRGDRLQLRAWLRLLTCANLIGTRVRQSLREDFEITLPRFDALAQLERAPEGLKMSELSRHLMVTGGNVTALVERLVADGLVERCVDERDRRRQIIRITAKGQRVFDAIAPVHQGWIDDMMAGMSRDDLRQLHRLLAALKESVEAATAKETT